MPIGILFLILLLMIPFLRYAVLFVFLFIFISFIVLLFLGRTMIRIQPRGTKTSGQKTKPGPKDQPSFLKENDDVEDADFREKK